MAQKFSYIVIAVPMMPISADSIRAGRRPYLTSYPLSAAEIMSVMVEHEPKILSLSVAVLPSHPNFAFKAGVI